MHQLTKTLLALADTGAYRCTVIAVVLNTGASGVTVTELADMLSQSPYSIKHTLRAGVKAGWLRTTGEVRKTAKVYTRTNAGNQLAQKLCES